MQSVIFDVNFDSSLDLDFADRTDFLGQVLEAARAHHQVSAGLRQEAPLSLQTNDAVEPFVYVLVQNLLLEKDFPFENPFYQPNRKNCQNQQVKHQFQFYRSAQNSQFLSHVSYRFRNYNALQGHATVGLHQFPQDNDLRHERKRQLLSPKKAPKIELRGTEEKKDESHQVSHDGSLLVVLENL